MSDVMEKQAAIEALARVKAQIEFNVKFNRKSLERAHESRRWQEASKHHTAVNTGEDCAILIQNEIDRLRAEIVAKAKP